MHSILPPMVSSYAGKNIGKGMSFWMVGGELGVMVGPMIITAILATSNIKYAPWLMIGGIAISLLLSIQLKNEPFEATVTKENSRIPGKDLLAVMLPLGGIMFMRSLMQTTAETYLPVYMLETGSSVWLAGASISILEGFGVLGVIIGGYASDHYGFKPSLLVSIIVSGLATLAFAFTDGILRIACLAVLGTATMMTLPIGMAITQEYFPKNRSLANGIYFAILFAVSALMSVTGGFLYDQIGGKLAFAVGGLVAFLAIPFIFILPKNKKAPTMEPGDN
jgi:FSR family fosmidomycin resistance protein-like MFS transporter